jgi:hypothetical protein
MTLQCQVPSTKTRRAPLDQSLNDQVPCVGGEVLAVGAGHALVRGSEIQLALIGASESVQ